MFSSSADLFGRGDQPKRRQHADGGLGIDPTQLRQGRKVARGKAVGKRLG